MITITKSRFAELKKNFKNKNIAIVGDVMMDSYYWGGVRRISPEAPVPVVEIDNEFNRFGGAANVAYNILTLGGNPVPFGVIGDDNSGEIFKTLMTNASINAECLFADTKRPTTVKTRIIANNQQLVRIDKESLAPITKEIQEKLLKALLERIDILDGIILQDYNKGVLVPGFIEKIINIARKKNVLITVDPKFHNFFNYKNVTVFKPNRKEAEDVLGMKIKLSEDISLAGKKLLTKLKSEYVLLTLGEGGIAVFEKDGTEKRMPTKARKVSDVSGAGDTVIATLTMALAAGANIYEASFLANYAAGIVVEEVGIAPIEIDRLFSTAIKG